MNSKLIYNAKIYLSDTLPGVFISISGGIFNEMFVAQMSFEQILSSRFLALLVRLITSRPYGMIRDLVLQLFKYKKGENFKYWALNTLSSVFIGGSLYLIVLYVSGVNANQAAKALGVVKLGNAFVGYPYGIIMDFLRKKFKVR